MFIAVDEKSENWPVIVLFPTAAVQSRLIAKKQEKSSTQIENNQRNETKNEDETFKRNEVNCHCRVARERGKCRKKASISISLKTFAGASREASLKCK